MSMEIKAADVVRLVLQFLQENSKQWVHTDYHRSFQTLQFESRICINTVNRKMLSAAIMAGHWDTTLHEVKNMMLPERQACCQGSKLLTLHELIIEDMLDHEEREAALFAFDNFVRDNVTDKELQERTMRLEYLCKEGTKADLFKDCSKQKKKEIVLESILEEVLEPPAERLLKLLSQSLKYQVSQGLVNPNIKLDLFSDFRYEFKQEQELIAKQTEKVVKYPEESKVTALCFSGKGTYLAVGGSDGLIQLYDPNNYEVNNGLAYQNEGEFMFHTDSVVALCFNESQDMLASGDRNGLAKVWNVANGKCLRKIETGSHPVSAIGFGIEPSHVLCCFETIQLYGLRSTVMLREYKGHTSHINSLVVLEKSNQLLTCSKDGSVKCWNYHTQEQIKSYSPPSGLIVPEVSMIKCFGEGRMIICTRTNVLILSQPELKTFDNIYLETKQQTYCSWACSGLSGSYIYSCAEVEKGKFKLMVHNSKTKRVQYFVSLDSELLLLEHHPTRNLLVGWSRNGQISFWRP